MLVEVRELEILRLGLPWTWWKEDCGRVGESWYWEKLNGCWSFSVAVAVAVGGGLESLNGARVMVFEIGMVVLMIWGGAGAGVCDGLVGRGEGFALGNSSRVPSMVIQAGVQAGENSSCIGVKIAVTCVGSRWWHFA